MRKLEKLKSFNYLYYLKGFDHLNNGIISKSNFFSALGISGLTLDQQERLLLKNFYNERGEFNYRNFIADYESTKMMESEETIQNESDENEQLS